ncbi:hypothetical protein [Comamonas sp.]|uniref:hypothetical protein n=1 Tax=Comamonas sp. TaxID=34028 RepID=UPI00258B2C21|nr:hypothetical protein [Comamonas sp.]
MTTLPSTPSLLASHTFGREHLEPPPLPSSTQLGQCLGAGSMGVASSPAVAGASLPQDFDHIVRSVGEW